MDARERRRTSTEIEDWIIDVRNRVSDSHKHPTTRQLREWEAVESLERMILYEDSDLLVINKPPHVLSHATSDGTSMGIFEIARYTRPDQDIGMPHRLDRDTSGVLVLTKGPLALDRMISTFRTKQGLTKKYDAVVLGEYPQGEDVIDAELIYDARGRNVADIHLSTERRRKGVHGISSRTIINPKTLYTDPQGELRTALDVQIITGRTHQIRAVTFLARGHPIVNDGIYGVKEPHFRGRQMLHARQISFPHPITRNPIYVEAPMAPDMVDYIASLTPVRDYA